MPKTRKRSRRIYGVRYFWEPKTMPVCLYKTKDRDESHKLLEQVLREGLYPRAECREADAEGFYTVWSGPAKGG
jgi:hypothetical protein